MVSQLVKVIKKQEARGNGAESQADGQFLQDECHHIPGLLQGRNDAGTTAMISFRRHLVARMDGVAHVRKRTLELGGNLI